MTSPSPFEVARQIGKNFAPSIEREVDTSAIDNILQQAANEPDQMDSLIGQIVSRVSPANQKAAYQLLQNKRQKYTEAQNQKQYEDLATFLEEKNPESPIHQSYAQILRLSLPFEQKEKLAKSSRS